MNVKIYQSRLKTARQQLKIYNQKMDEATAARSKIADISIQIREMGMKLTVFAEELGVNYSTLRAWIADRERPLEYVIEKEGDNIDMGALNRAKPRMDKQTTPKEAIAIYMKEKRKGEEDLQLEKLVRELGDAMYQICDRLSLSALDRDVLVTVEKFSTKISNHLSEFLSVGASEVSLQ